MLSIYTWRQVITSTTNHLFRMIWLFFLTISSFCLFSLYSPPKSSCLCFHSVWSNKTNYTVQWYVTLFSSHSLFTLFMLSFDPNQSSYLDPLHIFQITLLAWKLGWNRRIHNNNSKAHSKVGFMHKQPNALKRNLLLSIHTTLFVS